MSDSAAPPVPDDPIAGRPVHLAHEVLGAGTPIVLITGTGYPAATWGSPFLEPLAARCRVVTFDHRGVGDTPGTTGLYSTRLFAADVVGLLDELELDSAHVLGHSMGGRVAQWIALDHPERVRSLVLAASGPGQFDPSHRQTAGIPVAAAARMVEEGYEAYIRGLMRRTFFTEGFAAERPDVVRWLGDAFWDHRPQLEDYLKHVAARQEHRTSDRLEEITTPALVVIGDLDTHVGGTGSHWDQSQFLAERLPHAELRVVTGSPHGLFWMAPDEMASIVGDWVERQERRG